MGDKQRLRAMARGQIRETLPEKIFDEITSLAARICGTPRAAINLIEGDTGVFKSSIGLISDRIERRHAFCDLPMTAKKTVMIEDASKESRFDQNPYVQRPPFFKFYAGVPLITPEDEVIGTLCVLGLEPRVLTPSQLRSLESLARIVLELLESRINDFVDKQQAEESLEKQLELQNAVLENLADGVIACNAEGQLTLFNDASRKFHGLDLNLMLKPEEWAPYYQLFHADGQTLMRSHEIPLLRAFNGETVKDAEMVLVTAAGERRRVLASGRSLMDKFGQKLGAVIAMRDISEMRQAQETLEATNRTLQTLIDVSPVGISLLDNQNRVQTWNAACEKLYGWSKEEVIGRVLADALKGNQDEIEQTVAISKLVTEKFTAEFERLRKDGTRVDVQLSVVPLLDQKQQVQSYLGVAVNISDIRQRERKLIEANQALLAASAAKSDFLANMSHEIRTPLNGVIALSDLLMTDSLTEQQRDQVKTLQASAQTLLAIISDILDFSKVEAGKIDLEKSTFDLKDILNQVVQTVGPQARAKNLGFRKVMLKSQTGFRGDSHRIGQVLMNLANNAVKFTNEGEVTITVSSSPLENQRTQLRFEVKDSGIGVPFEHRERLFDAFSQADASTTRKYGGTGLGLSICKRLVTLMQGELGFESEEGRGSTFWFTLPLENSFEVVSRWEAPEMNIDLKRPEYEFTRVLIAEDNLVNQKIIRAMLGKLGVVADVVGDGRSVLRAVKEMSYDLILMDCQMPEMDGYDATRAIRAMSEAIHHEIPIVALTANAMIGDRDKCLAVGMNDYLSKPIRLHDLMDVLSRNLKRRSRAG